MQCECNENVRKCSERAAHEVFFQGLKIMVCKHCANHHLRQIIVPLKPEPEPNPDPWKEMTRLKSLLEVQSEKMETLRNQLAARTKKMKAYRKLLSCYYLEFNRNTVEVSKIDEMPDN